MFPCSKCARGCISFMPVHVILDILQAPRPYPRHLLQLRRIDVDLRTRVCWHWTRNKQGAISIYWCANIYIYKHIQNYIYNIISTIIIDITIIVIAIIITTIITINYGYCYSYSYYYCNIYIYCIAVYIFTHTIACWPLEPRSIRRAVCSTCLVIWLGVCRKIIRADVGHVENSRVALRFACVVEYSRCSRTWRQRSSSTCDGWPCARRQLFLNQDQHASKHLIALSNFIDSLYFPSVIQIYPETR